MGRLLDKFKIKLGSATRLKKEEEREDSRKKAIVKDLPPVEVRKRSYARIIAAVDLELEKRWVSNTREGV